MEKICEGCNKTYQSSSIRFCSVQCYSNHKRKTQVELVCAFCGKTKLVSKTRAAKDIHCSRRCYVQSVSQDGLRICKDCKLPKAIEEFNLHSHGKETRRRYCSECERERARQRSHTPHERWMHSKRRAAKSGQVWNVTFEAFDKLLSKCCHYCGGQLNGTGCGLDRIDNDEGYVETNVVPCCKQCNIVKNSFFSYDEMMLLAPTLTQIRERKCP